MHDIKSKDVHIVFSMVEYSNNGMNENQKQLQLTMSGQLTEVIGQLVNKLVGKNMIMTYNFENFEIDIPNAKGPGGRELGAAMWTINGRIAITTETHDVRGRA